MSSGIVSDPVTFGCQPKTCKEIGACGAVDDGCGNTINCGCPKGMSCWKHKCIAPENCKPKSCKDQGLECGEHDDWCGGKVYCGFCPGSLECRGGKCVPCVPKTCAALNLECGLADDGCGNIIDCGKCPEKGGKNIIPIAEFDLSGVQEAGEGGEPTPGEQGPPPSQSKSSAAVPIAIGLALLGGIGILLYTRK